jgi:hypothetical protein
MQSGRGRGGEGWPDPFECKWGRNVTSLLTEARHTQTEMSGSNLRQGTEKMCLKVLLVLFHFRYLLCRHIESVQGEENKSNSDLYLRPYFGIRLC